LTEDVFELIFQLQKEHTLQHLEFIWDNLLTVQEMIVEVMVEGIEIMAVEIMAVVVVEEVTVVDDHPTEEATIAEDLRPHIIEAVVVVVVLEGIIVQDLGHIHPVVIERRQIEDDVVEI